MLFIVLRAKTPQTVPKAVSVAEQVKRLKHKRDWEVMDVGEELHQ